MTEVYSSKRQRSLVSHIDSHIKEVKMTDLPPSRQNPRRSVHLHDLFARSAEAQEIVEISQDIYEIKLICRWFPEINAVQLLTRRPEALLESFWTQLCPDEPRHIASAANIVQRLSYIPSARALDWSTSLSNGPLQFIQELDAQVILYLEDICIECWTRYFLGSQTIVNTIVAMAVELRNTFALDFHKLCEGPIGSVVKEQLETAHPLVLWILDEQNSDRPVNSALDFVLGPIQLVCSQERPLSETLQRLSILGWRYTRWHARPDWHDLLSTDFSIIELIPTPEKLALYLTTQLYQPLSHIGAVDLLSPSTSPHVKRIAKLCAQLVDDVTIAVKINPTFISYAIILPEYLLNKENRNHCAAAAVGLALSGLQFNSWASPTLWLINPSDHGVNLRNLFKSNPDCLPHILGLVHFMKPHMDNGPRMVEYFRSAVYFGRKPLRTEPARSKSYFEIFWAYVTCSLIE